MKWFLMIFAFSVCVWAQDAAPVAAQATPAVTDQVISGLQVANDKIPVSLPVGVTTILVSLAAVAVRVYPTAKSWCLIFTPLAAIFGLISIGAGKLQQLSLFLASSFNNVTQDKQA